MNASERKVGKARVIPDLDGIRAEQPDFPVVNNKGYKVLNPKIGLIYGDGMYRERYIRTLLRMREMGYAACNLVIGVGGILRNHSRDTLGFAIKATYIEINGIPKEIWKDPVTDRGKKSHRGLMYLKNTDGNWWTHDQCTHESEKSGELFVAYKDGRLIIPYLFADIRERVRVYLENRKCAKK